MSAFPELRKCLYLFGKKRSIGKKQERERTFQNTCGSVYMEKQKCTERTNTFCTAFYCAVVFGFKLMFSVFCCCLVVFCILLKYFYFLVKN